MAEIWAFAPIRRELVVHSGEWATGFLEKGRNRVKAPIKRELVVHSEEWTTSYGCFCLSKNHRTQKALPTGGLFNMAVSFYALFLSASRELANFFDHEPDPNQDDDGIY